MFAGKSISLHRDKQLVPKHRGNRYGLHIENIYIDCDLYACLVRSFALFEIISYRIRLITGILV